MQYNRNASSVEEQIEALRGRGMSVKDEVARRHLEMISYYRLLAYVVPFENKSAAFEDGRDLVDSNFDNVISLYTFDRKLRLLVLDAIERIEVALRAQWCKHVTLSGQTKEYLDRFFYVSEIKYFSDVKSLHIQCERSQDDDVRKHFAENANLLPPADIASEVMSFGLLSKFISNIKTDSNKQEIASHFEFESFKAFSSAVRHMNYVRNIAAHHNRLWNRYIVVKMIVPKRPDSLVSSMYPQKCGAESKRLYNTLVLLCHMLRIIAPEAEWKTRLMELLGTCPLPITEHMGFPEDWKCRSVWKANE